jgi:hypothetical protein
MRTTIQLADESRETLLSIAQERGEKGVSRVVEEAVSFYLAERNKPVVQPTQTPALLQGRFARIGAELDREIGSKTSLVSMIRALVRGGLRLIPVPRAQASRP